MAKRYWRNRVIMAKMETVYGQDALPTGAANTMLMTDVEFEPFLGQDLSRDLVLPYMGHQGVILEGNYGRLTGSIEIAGSGEPGTAPAYGPMFRSCGMQEVITADTDVKYTPVSRNFESCSIYFNDDGVNHILVGARGTVTLSLTPGQIPRYRFTMTGLVGTIADIPLPALTTAGFITPVPVNKLWTSVSLHGWAGACEGLTLDFGNQVEPRMLINAESIEQTDRQVTGSAIFEAVHLADKNWLQAMREHQVGALVAQQGTVAGNIVQIDGPTVQLGRITYGETQRIRNNTIPLFCKPTSAGNDEITITVK